MIKESLLLFPHFSSVKEGTGFAGKWTGGRPAPCHWNDLLPIRLAPQRLRISTDSMGLYDLEKRNISYSL